MPDQAPTGVTLDRAERLFARQQARAALPDGGLDHALLGRLVCAAYAEADRDRGRTDRAITLMAEELEGASCELERLVAQLSVQNLRFEVALDNMSHGLMMCAPDGRVEVCNARLGEVLRLPPGSSVAGRHLREVVGPQGDGAIAAGGTGAARNFEQVRGDRIIFVSAQPMADGGCVLTCEDVTNRRQAEARIAHLAQHDALTGLANRTRFHAALEAAVLRSHRGEGFAVLWLDLDRFKAVNDTLGHQAGDALLCAVAARLRAIVRESDLVGRLGGDEFAILQAQIGDPAAATSLARRVVAEIGRPFELGAHTVSIGTSVGITMAPSDGVDPEVLMKNADLALYRAKAQGRGGWCFFEHGMDCRMQERQVLEAELRRAIADDTLDLAYQPFTDAESGRVLGCEALLRWNHPVRGPIPPTEIIAFAEETGLIQDLGAWVLRRACACAAGWPEHMVVAVNVSAMQFRNPGLVDVATRALLAARLPPARLELEVTESILMQEVGPTLRRLRRLGVRLSLDDFGTGYAPLRYLRSFPFDKIKIDQSFVRDIESRAILSAIAGLGRALGMRTTAEGVETEAQMTRVRAEGCTDLQGYLIGYPMPAEQLETWLAVAASVRPDVQTMP